MVSFDTELFGHWWFEGIVFIEQVIRKLHEYTAVQMCTASEYLQETPPVHAMELPQSSWGSGGHWQVWLNNETEWMWPVIEAAEKTMKDLVEKHFNSNEQDALKTRALKQLGRELFLLESSDWPFLVTTAQAKQYAVERFRGHQERFNTIYEMLKSGNIDEGKLSEIENIDNCFPELALENFKLTESSIATSTTTKR